MQKLADRQLLYHCPNVQECGLSRNLSWTLTELSSRALRDQHCYVQVVLDLDETLVSSYNARNIPKHLLNGEQRYFIVRYSPGNGCTDAIAVFPRPGVRAFLKELSAIAEVVLYTAGNAGEVSDNCRTPDTIH